MKKLCSDKLCDRKGQLLPLSDFNGDRSSKDGRSYQCKRCHARRRGEQWRASKNPELQRKPTERVYAAIERGFRTREQLEAETGLHEDVISDALARLWDTKRIQIHAGQYYPIRKAA